MARKGKYHDWITDDGLTRVKGWARDGLSDLQISKNIGITQETFYQWQKRFPEFSDAIKKGKAPVDIEVENALLKSAKGYDYEEVKTYIEETAGGKKKRVEKTTKHVPPNTTAAIFWLKNRKPEEWFDRKYVEHSGEMTQNVKNDLSGLTDEELRKLADMERD